MLKPGDNVVTIIDGELKEGRVIKVFESLNKAIVDINDDYLKIDIDDLADAPATKDQDVEEDKAPKYKEEITITPEEFRDTLVDTVGEVLNDLREKHVDIERISTDTILFAVVGAKLEKALFSEGDDSDER